MRTESETETETETEPGPACFRSPVSSGTKHRMIRSVLLGLVLMGCAASSRSSAPAAEPTLTSGALTKADVQRGMGAIKDQVAACYERYKQPGLAILLVVIRGNGEVALAQVEGKLMGSEEASCLASAARNARFRAFGGADETVHYPISLR